MSPHDAHSPRDVPPGAVRTPDERFLGLADFNFEPHYLDWRGLRMHYLDEPATSRTPGEEHGVFLLLHGEPSWSYLYRNWIPALTAAGYRCVAPDHFGFGRSDKPIDDSWYTIERHCEALTHLIDTLDLSNIHIVVQDWAGPIGLRQVVDNVSRFSRAFILNTWLHNDAFDYSEGIRWWRAAATDPQQFGGDMPTGRIVAGTLRRGGHDTVAVEAAYDAPFVDAEAKAGARRFPLCLPFAEPELGNAADQQRCFDALNNGVGVDVHVIFGDADPIFTVEWGRTWAQQIPGATFETIAGAGHFVQEDAPADCIAAIRRHLPS